MGTTKFRRPLVTNGLPSYHVSLDKQYSNGHGKTFLIFSRTELTRTLYSPLIGIYVVYLLHNYTLVVLRTNAVVGPNAPVKIEVII